MPSAGPAISPTWKLSNVKSDIAHIAAAAVSLLAAGCTAAGTLNFTAPTDSPSATKAKSANLYVASVDSGNGLVSEYPPGSGTPQRVVKEGINTPQAIGFDRGGNLYVLSKYGGPSGEGRVTVYAPGSSKPATIIDQPITYGYPNDMALDASGNLYVANTVPTRGNRGQYSGNVAVYSPAGKLLRTISAGINYPERLIFDGAGNLYVSNYQSASGLHGVVTVYGSGKTAVLRTLTLPKKDDTPIAMAFDGAGNLFVGNHPAENYLAGCIYVYAPGQTTPARTISASIDQPVDLAFDSSGNLYVANAGVAGGPVTEYSPNATAPSRTIDPGDRPYALALDASGKLYVGWSIAHLVAVYPTSGTTPSRTIVKDVGTPSRLAFGP